MKKTLKLLAILAIALILLTGCAKMDYTVDVKSDGKAEVSYIIAVENQYLEEDKTSTTTSENSIDMSSLSSSDTSNMYLESLKSEAKDAEKKGYTTKEFKDDQYTGYTITKSFNNVEDISLQDAFGESIIKNSSDGKIKFEKNGSNVKISQDTTFDLSQYSQGYEIIYTVNLPVKVTENNATKVDGNKLTWVLTESNTTNILGSTTSTTEDTTKKVSFKAEGTTTVLNTISESIASISIIGIILIIVGIVFVLGIIVIIIICVTKSKKKTKSTPTNTVEQINDDKKSDENK